MDYSDNYKGLNDIERRVLSAVQFGLPMSQTPYQDIAAKIGIEVGQLLEILNQWKAEGKIRRLGAIVNHFKMGCGTGAMVVWNVSEDKIDQTGRLFASCPKVSHAYQRPSSPQWPYSLYTMVHAQNAGELEQTIQAMSRDSGVTDFRQLKTIEELKKVPPTYIEMEQD